MVAGPLRVKPPAAVGLLAPGPRGGDRAHTERFWVRRRL